jgi:hypothetical protein
MKSTLKPCGTFKGLIRIVDSADSQHPVVNHDFFVPKDYVVRCAYRVVTCHCKRGHQKRLCVCRVYLLKGHKLIGMDDNGKSDPYVKVKLGKTVIDDKSRCVALCVCSGWWSCCC